MIYRPTGMTHSSWTYGIKIQIRGGGYILIFNPGFESGRNDLDQESWDLRMRVRNHILDEMAGFVGEQIDSVFLGFLRGKINRLIND